MGDFSLAFPVSTIDSLGESLEFQEGGRFSLTTDFILNPNQKLIIELTTKCSITPSLDLRSEALEFYDVFIDVMSIAHIELFKLHLCIPNWVMGSEVGLKFQHECQVVIHPVQLIVNISRQEIWFKPLEGHALKVGLGKGNFGPVQVESARFVLEIEFALDKECLHAAQVDEFPY
jgi:hypothetical protein